MYSLPDERHFVSTGLDDVFVWGHLQDHTYRQKHTLNIACLTHKPIRL